ncbi:thiamine-phosphate kinase [soil metagenome]
MSAPDEFEQIARLFRPLTRGAAEAFDLLDDAAAIPSRPGFDLVVTKDALVAGVHFQPDDPPDIVARKLLRSDISYLAANGAEPYGYVLMTAWPADFNWAQRQEFARGLDEDGLAFDVILLGGDTVSTPGPLVVSMTLMGWVPSGTMIRRAGAKAGDLLLVSGPIGDGWLDWGPGWGQLDRRWLPDAHRLPTPRLDLREALRAHVSAAADVSDGLVADAGHIALASGLGLRLDLERMPLSKPARAWLATQDDQVAALLRLATGGDDYEIVCTASADHPALIGLTVIGEMVEGEGIEVRVGDQVIDPGQGGWIHS